MSRRRGRILTAAIALAALAAIFFGLRSYGSFLLLRSAYEIGRPQVSNLRAWMTLDHIAATYRVPERELLARLSLPADTKRDQSLKAIADHRGISRFDFVRQVQRAIGETAPPIDDTVIHEGGFLSGVADRTLSAVLAYGYPALGAALLLGAAGLPLPTGVVAVLAGSLAALGHIQWFRAALIAIVASLAGDALAYLIGRTVSKNFLARHGRLFAYSPERLARVQNLFGRWGGLTVLFSRTLVSHLSSLISLLAGLSRYPWPSFLLFSGLGRVVWSTAYLGLGFVIGSNIDAASQFLGNLSGLLAALAALTVLTIYRTGIMRADDRR
jgi:membrane protein DedA with SNARE-associated domain